MITGSAELAERSIIDATGLAETSSRDFRDWLVLWAHLATARSRTERRPFINPGNCETIR